MCRYSKFVVGIFGVDYCLSFDNVLQVEQDFFDLSGKPHVIRQSPYLQKDGLGL